MMHDFDTLAVHAGEELDPETGALRVPLHMSSTFKLPGFGIKLFAYATSLGHAHSLLFYYPTDMYVDAAPYLSSEQKTRIREWMGEGIVRASVGLENVNDLIADLDQALHGRTFRGWVGPLAYRLMKGSS